VFTSFLLELLVYPGIYEVWKWHFHREEKTGSEDQMEVLEPAHV